MSGVPRGIPAVTRLHARPLIRWGGAVNRDVYVEQTKGIAYSRSMRRFDSGSVALPRAASPITAKIRDWAQRTGYQGAAHCS